jgi:hypothetical protein
MHRLRRFVRTDAVAEPQKAVRMRGDVVVVRDEQDRHAV